MNKVQRFFWRLWVVLSGVWVVALVLLGSWEEMRTDRGDLLINWPIYWVFIVGPPVMLVVLGALASWILGAQQDSPNSNS